jgi:hypothetical protein
MTALVLPDIDNETLEKLRRRIPSLSDIEIPSIEIPSMQQAGRKADQTVDRLLGRSRTPVWPWVAAGVFLVALAGTVAAWMTWNRRASWTRQSDPWAEDLGTHHTTIETDLTGTPDLSGTTVTDPMGGDGLTAVEASLITGTLEE